MSLASAAAGMALGRDALLILLADLHSPYRRLPQLLRAVRDIRDAAEGAPAAVIINGDVFERGNVAALRSGAALDWSFLAALAELAPTFVNIGNHETAIIDDMAEFVVAARAVGVEPIGNVRDRRSGAYFAEPCWRFTLGALTVGLLGLAPQHPLLYRREARAALSVPEPVAFAREAMAKAFEGVDQPVLVSHAGVAPDRELIRDLPPGAFLMGGHDHLLINMQIDGVAYAHAGSWGSAIGVVGLGGGAPPSVALIAVGDDAPHDAAFGRRCARLLDAHLLPEDREVIARLPRGMDLSESAFFASEAIRRAAGADVAMLGHTGFGATLPAGPLTRFDFDAWFRFDGDVLMAEFDAADLAAAMARANQHERPTLEGRTGDFLYAVAPEPEPGRRYRVAVADWTALHQLDYLGAEGHRFERLPGLRLKPIVETALRALDEG